MNIMTQTLLIIKKLFSRSVIQKNYCLHFSNRWVNTANVHLQCLNFFFFYKETLPPQCIVEALAIFFHKCAGTTNEHLQ